MNIHEHQAKEILKQFGAQVPNGVVIFNIDDIENKTNNFKSTNLVVKAQIHAGGRGKAGGIKIVNNKNELSLTEKESDIILFLLYLMDRSQLVLV